VRFYVPEWDDSVDADYDFEHDEHSELGTDERELQYIWDIFEYETTPIDGVLISREKVEESPTKFDRLTTHGVHSPETTMNIPDWLPTISDCGAWGYKSLPFPPYGNAEMLDFYEQLDVTVGVTIDHLVLGAGKDSRLYLDERAFEDTELSPEDLPDDLTSHADVMVAEWPADWPDYVQEYEPSIYQPDAVDAFTAADFDGDVATVIDRLRQDPRAVYREDDTRFRYTLTLNNAEEMKTLYDAGDYSFRLMVAIQGWDPESYADATETVLDQGYRYLGIGGVAGSRADDVRDIVTGVGNRVKDHERAHTTRVDTHVFGFAKTDAFETVGRTGMTSFDSASMLRAAWTGGGNYRITNDERYDAVRVRFGSNRDALEERIEKALRGQEVLHALRAFDAEESLAAAIRDWHADAEQALSQLRPYLRDHRHDDGYDQRLLQDVEEQFRTDYAHGREVRASFSRPFRKKIVKLLRADDPDDPVDFQEYDHLLDTAREIFEGTFPRMVDRLDAREEATGAVATFDQVWMVVEDYVHWIGDTDLLDEYERLLRDRPWEQCNCPICTEYGIEVAIFRGNNRNRRRGFHNTRRFYDEFEADLPKVLVATPADASFHTGEACDAFLARERPAFWEAVHDLPVAEIGAFSAQGLTEWWAESPDAVSFSPQAMAEAMATRCTRYQDLYLYDADQTVSSGIVDAVEDSGCRVHRFADAEALRAAVLDRLGYTAEFLPRFSVQKGLTEF